MIRHKFRLLGSCITAATLIGVGSSPAMAQAADEAAQQSVSESAADIIVTAKNRVERLQDVPLAITAFSGEDLRSAQVNGLQDLQTITPNLNLYAGVGRNDPGAFGMRGLTPNTSDERYQGVSFFLDGIALSGQLASLDLNTVERVEVIKGPQSATFGRATYSGAINFITKEPSGDTVSGAVRARGGLTKSGPEASWLLSGSLTVPLVQDKLWLSGGLTAYQNGAVAKALDDGAPVGRERTTVATASLFFRPDDTLSFHLRGLYSHDRDWVAMRNTQHPRDWLEAGLDLVPLPRASGSFFPKYLLDIDVDQIGNSGSQGTKRNRYFASLIASKMFGDYELNYRGGYFFNRDARDTVSVPRSIRPGQDPVFGDLIGTGAVTLTGFAGISSTSGEVFENTSHQLMLLSPSTGRFRWRLGAYYFWEADETLFPLQGTPANPTGRARKEIVTNYAGFGGFDFELTNSLTLSGEGRIAKEKMTYTACPSCINPIAQGASTTSTDFSPRITVSYKPSDDHLIYALFSKGVKSARQSRIVLGGVPSIKVAEPEELSNYEIGAKNSLLDRKLTINLAGFYQHVRNQQLVSSTNVLVNGQIQVVSAADNVGESKVWGFEVDAVASVTPAFTLRGSLGYAKHKFTGGQPIILQATSVLGFPGNPGDPVVLDGKTQANVPRWTGFVSAEYRIPDIFSDFGLMLRLDGSYRGKSYADLSNLVAIRQSWIANSRIGLSNDAIDIALYGRNIFNSQRPIGSGLAGGPAPCAFIETNRAVYGNNQQCLPASPPRPAEFGIEVSYKF